MPKNKSKSKKVVVSEEQKLDIELKQQSLQSQKIQNTKSRSTRAAQRNQNKSRNQSTESKDSEKLSNDNNTQSKVKTKPKSSVQNNNDESKQDLQKQQTPSRQQKNKQRKDKQILDSKIVNQDEQNQILLKEQQQNIKVDPKIIEIKAEEQKLNLLQRLSKNQQQQSQNKNSRPNNKRARNLKNTKQTLKNDKENNKIRQTQLQIPSSGHSSRSSKFGQQSNNDDQTHFENDIDSQIQTKFQEQNLQEPQYNDLNKQEFNIDYNADEEDQTQDFTHDINNLQSIQQTIQDDIYQEVIDHESKREQINNSSADQQEQVMIEKKPQNKKRQQSTKRRSTSKNQSKKTPIITKVKINGKVDQNKNDTSDQQQQIIQQVHNDNQIENQVHDNLSEHQIEQDDKLQQLLEQQMRDLEIRKKQQEDYKQIEMENFKQRQDQNQDYQQWQMRSKMFSNAIESVMRKGVPQIYDNKEEYESWLSKINFDEIIVKLNETKQEYEAENGSQFGYYESHEFARVLRKFLGLYIEGSSLNSFNILKLCMNQIQQSQLHESLEGLEMYQIELLITKLATRKRYGIKQQKENLLNDENPRSMFCWELSETNYLSEFFNEAKVKKVRTLRAILGKKMQQAQLILDMINDINTFENDDKLQKLNQEYQTFQTILMKEFQNDQQKRKRNQDQDAIDNKNENQKNDKDESSNPSSIKNSKQNKNLNNKRMKITEDDIEQSFVSQINEQSYQLDIKHNSSNSHKSNNQQDKKNPVKDLKSFFPILPNKKNNLEQQQINIQPKEMLIIKNPYISIKNQPNQTEARKQQLIYQHNEWPSNDQQQLIQLLNDLKQKEIQNQKQIQEQNHMSGGKRLKHIHMFNSSMSYNGDVFFKKSSKILCRNPFQQDKSCIDYDQGSDEEWQEIHCDNLEDDNLLAEDENSELMQDDPELKREGFIVADDYYSQRSDSSIQPDDYEDTGFVERRRDLLKMSLERQEQRLRSTFVQKPYIYTLENHEIGEYRAVAFKKRVKMPLQYVQNQNQPTEEQNKRESNISIVQIIKDGNQFIKTILVQPQFPLKAQEEKKNQDDYKIDIKHYIQEIIEMSHGSLLSKKQLIEIIKQKYQDLRRNRIETFVRECFDKERKPLESKVRNIYIYQHSSQQRLFAKVEVVVRYGGDDSLIQNMPMIAEKKREEELRLRQQQQPMSTSNSKNTPQEQSKSKTISEENSQSEFNTYLQRSDDKDEAIFLNDVNSNISNASPFNRRQSQNSKNQSKKNQSKKQNDTIMKENQQNEIAQQLDLLQVNNQNDQNEMRRKNQSYVSFQDRSAFQSAQHDNKHIDNNADEMSAIMFNNDINNNHASQQNDLDYTVVDLHLSQQAIVQLKDCEHSINISEQSFQRNTQQCQQTPIQNHKKLMPENYKPKYTHQQQNKKSIQGASNRQSRSRGRPPGAKNFKNRISQDIQQQKPQQQQQIQEIQSHGNSNLDHTMNNDNLRNDVTDVEINYYTPARDNNLPFFSQANPNIQQLQNLSQDVNLDLSQQFSQLNNNDNYNNSIFKYDNTINNSVFNFGGLQSSNQSPQKNQSKRLADMLKQINTNYNNGETIDRTDTSNMNDISFGVNNNNNNSSQDNIKLNNNNNNNNQDNNQNIFSQQENQSIFQQQYSSINDQLELETKQKINHNSYGMDDELNQAHSQQN